MYNFHAMCICTLLYCGQTNIFVWPQYKYLTELGKCFFDAHDLWVRKRHAELKRIGKLLGRVMGACCLGTL